MTESGRFEASAGGFGNCAKVFLADLKCRLAFVRRCNLTRRSSPRKHGVILLGNNLNHVARRDIAHPACLAIRPYILLATTLHFRFDGSPLRPEIRNPER